MLNDKLISQNELAIITDQAHYLFDKYDTDYLVDASQRSAAYRFPMTETEMDLLAERIRTKDDVEHFLSSCDNLPVFDMYKLQSEDKIRKQLIEDALVLGISHFLRALNDQYIINAQGYSYRE